MNAQTATEPHAAQSFVFACTLSKISTPQNIRRNVQKIRISVFSIVINPFEKEELNA